MSIDVESAGFTVGPWQYIGDPGKPAFQNGWSNWDAADRASNLRYRKFGDMLQFTGMVQSDGLLGDSAWFSSLPVAYRPTLTSYTWSGIITEASVGFMWPVGIQSSGRIYFPIDPFTYGKMDVNLLIPLR